MAKGGLLVFVGYILLTKSISCNVVYTGLSFYSKPSDGNGLNMTSISVTSIKKAISDFQEDFAHVSNFLFPGRFCTRLSIFIITFCSSIGLR
jgi:hypothetical protein